MKGICLFFIVVLLSGCGPRVVHKYETVESRDPKQAKLVNVAKVISGDTIELEDGRIIKYLGVRTPQGKEPLREKAKKANEWLLRRSQYRVLLEFDKHKRDRDGHHLAYVYAPYQFVYCFVNLELIEHGFTLVDTSYLSEIHIKDFEKAENIARREKRGLWE